LGFAAKGVAIKSYPQPEASYLTNLEMTDEGADLENGNNPFTVGN